MKRTTYFCDVCNFTKTGSIITSPFKEESISLISQTSKEEIGHFKDLCPDCRKKSLSSPKRIFT